MGGIARITTLAGYVHWRLTGRHVLGVGEASGVFPIGADGRSFDADMIAAFDGAVAAPWSLADILPEVAVAGREAGRLTESGAALTLAGLMRSHLFSLFASMAHGVAVLRRSADVPIDSMFAHGGIFATPEIPQRTLAAAFDTPVSVATTASQGGAWGMSLLAGYLLWGRGRALEDYLDREIFADARSVTITATAQEVAEYGRYLERFIAALPVQAAAVEVF